MFWLVRPSLIQQNNTSNFSIEVSICGYLHPLEKAVAMASSKLDKEKNMSCCFLMQNEILAHWNQLWRILEPVRYKGGSTFLVHLDIMESGYSQKPSCPLFPGIYYKRAELYRHILFPRTESSPNTMVRPRVKVTSDIIKYLFYECTANSRYNEHLIILKLSQSQFNLHRRNTFETRLNKSVAPTRLGWNEADTASRHAISRAGDNFSHDAPSRNNGDSY